PTVMAVVMLMWSDATRATRGGAHPLLPWKPDLNKKWDEDQHGKIVPKLNPITGQQEDPLGVLGRYPTIAEPLRHPTSWWSFIAVIGIVIAFGHSILAMSGEETLAQVYRE